MNYMNTDNIYKARKIYRENEKLFITLKSLVFFVRVE
jgi:hypothetical protein